MFLPEYLVMVDTEMVGVVPGRDALLQVAMIKLKRVGSEYKASKDHLVAYLHYPGKPETDFHKKFLPHVFEACNRSSLAPSALKRQIHRWLGPLKGKVMPTGDCIATDLEFLLRNGCIDRPDIARDGKPIEGTFHYESFDLNPLKMVAFEKLGEKKKPGQFSGEHDALIDCLNQTLELNFILRHLLS